jgi:hypothetical protein
MNKGNCYDISEEELDLLVERSKGFNLIFNY